MTEYVPIIGMEIHVQLKTKTGLFCGCKNDSSAKKANIHTCPVCLGLPGALPVANKKAIEWTVKFGLALNCQINRKSKFDRKHYFYPDLPKGYQISQYDLPFCFEGFVNTSFGKVKAGRVHLEEDAGKLIHETINGKKVSLVDFNRSGVPLMEIVTGPDMHSSAQAKEYAKKIKQIVRYLDIGNCDMEKGEMRLEANISLQKKGETKLPNYKVELKNINSFRFLERGIEYEIKRQKEILDSGKTPDQETRGFNSEKGITYTQRSKEEAADYRYFPDPDLPPIRLDDKWMSKIESTEPELIDAIFSRWEKDYKVDRKLTELLFETAEESKWLDNLFSEAKKQKIDVVKLVNQLVNRKIKTVFDKDSLYQILNDFKKSVTVDDITDEQLMVVIKKILSINGKAVADYKSGKTNVINFLVGMVMREAKKKIEFKRLEELIIKIMSNDK
jgi:aspartyl-tRNA(Asn)/glutamyl-tRNA(Gln) amidotransferase subunit B